MLQREEPAADHPRGATPETQVPAFQRVPGLHGDEAITEGPFLTEQKWLRKSEQGDKWNRCLIEGMIVLSETGARDEQTTPP